MSKSVESDRLMVDGEQPYVQRHDEPTEQRPSWWVLASVGLLFLSLGFLAGAICAWLTVTPVL